MASFTGTNIQPPTSCQSGRPGSFFCLPAELRHMIYNLAVSSNEDMFFPIVSQREYFVDYPMPASKRSILQRSQRSSDLKPTVLALAHTCRQAYIESSFLHYECKNFYIHSGHLLQKFVQDVSPVHVKSIKRLRVYRLASMAPPSPPSTGKEVGGPTSAPRPAPQLAQTRDTSNNGHISEQQINILKHFHGLEELIVRDKRQPQGQESFGSSIRILATLHKSLIHLTKLELRYGSLDGTSGHINSEI